MFTEPFTEVIAEYFCADFVVKPSKSHINKKDQLITNH
ncbi:hypothetical protein P20652_2622 [Pseudoalteromonas sp. BSi20652]|nr:hypothetical protein P20652_2622 [Pseudoalteromonas sp. BSi20652]